MSSKIPALKSIRSELSKDWNGIWDNSALAIGLYATDASVYSEDPLAVAIPKDIDAFKEVVRVALKHKTPIIPRGAGTSLAGQVVGNGLVVDSSKYLKKVIEINAKEKYAWVEPGVVRDELNFELDKHGLYFGPETSTTNRCTIGGMIGNNSCGSRSIVYGSVRNHLLELKFIGADGKEHHIGRGIKPDPFVENLCNKLKGFLDDQTLAEIKAVYPKSNISRRNHGYALDCVLQENGELDLCKLFAGSEGTLGVITQAKINLSPLPGKHQALLCLMCSSVDFALKTNISALNYNPTASELIDDNIIRCTENQIGQQENRFFIKGNPGAILVVEFCEEEENILEQKLNGLTKEVVHLGLIADHSIVQGDDMNRVWNLRKAGLGLLSNIPGDAKPVAVVEDTAVDPIDLPAYIQEFNVALQKRNLSAVHYAHAGSGELHLRPVLDLKSDAGRKAFFDIAMDVALLVKKYRGALSGEHGDGRLRGYFIKTMYGERIYKLFQDVKRLWDPEHLFNPGKIVETPHPIENLRFSVHYHKPELNTGFHFRQFKSLQGAVELCNGSGDCVKSEIIAGTLCPSYQATKDEKDSTRGRANILRRTLAKGNPDLNNPELKKALEYCISCKACKRECPSNVDMAKIKAEVSYQNSKNSFKLAQWAISRGYGVLLKARALRAPASLLFPLLRGPLQISSKRSAPNFSFEAIPFIPSKSGIWIYVDEFTAVESPKLVIELQKITQFLKLDVGILPPFESARSAISMGDLKHAKKLIHNNINLLKKYEVNELIGIEPSAYLGLKEEWLDLCGDNHLKLCQELAGKIKGYDSFLLEHFSDHGTPKFNDLESKKPIQIHEHCHHKALVGKPQVQEILKILGYQEVETLDSGCCGMAGFFGYQKKNYQISKAIANNKLLPKIKQDSVLIAAGTSCRHQIKDLKNRKALHPITFIHRTLGL
ncbi:FAD-binding and (Fe-S)-binding domain-containing protein [Luteibaculum oceani]|uniref:FAD-binding oxidoreductase n=1 Tax=Luteibaculum oceani TaxID=1294296 RepID=A0A5C6VJX2_9FLAO|nr:FAD-binding and (Fe-S)-binding domain-containing protein [Luteibaculum oceani]TXC85320.1 FAD-binding oxidoreductase [Luteibaculum oceani]